MLLTFGHGTATAGRMTELLRGAGVAALVDVRTAPGSRRHPHVTRAELERWLPEADISYRWDKRLGGFRKASPDSPDTAWGEDMFRGYAAHMRTGEFRPPAARRPDRGAPPLPRPAAPGRRPARLRRGPAAAALNGTAGQTAGQPRYRPKPLVCQVAPAAVMANASYPSRPSTQSRAAAPMAKAAVA